MVIKIGIETIGGTRITGTIDTSISAQTGTINATGPHFEGTIPMNGVSTTTDVAQRVFDFVNAVTDTANVVSLYPYQDDNVVTLFSANGDLANDLDITDGNDGSTFIDNVTISPVASSSSGVKFAGGQKANQSYFDLAGDAAVGPKFTYAMNNFLAETVNFFLEQKPVGQFGSSGLNSIVSKPSNQFAAFKSGYIYYMDLILQKDEEFVMFEGPASFQTPGARVNFTGSARGIHYGPAMRWTNESSEHNADDEYFRNLADPAFAAYTPPYFYGTSIARFKFDPTKAENGLSGVDGTISFAIEDIQAATEIEYYNMCERHPEFAQLPDEYTTTKTDLSIAGSKQTPASASFMHLSSSFELLGKTSDSIIKQKNNQNGLGLIEIQPDDENPRWVIHPKFESPVLNFSGNVGPATGLDRSSLTSLERACFDSKGMWYGSGSLPDANNAGIRMRLIYPFQDKSQDPTKQNLAKALGFDSTAKSVGTIADKKTISEAIVAIPVDPDGNFYDLNTDMYNLITKNIAEGNPDLMGLNGLEGNQGASVGADGELNIQAYLTKDIEKTSIGEMIRKMDKFVVPPHLDFRNPTIYDSNNPEASSRKPFAMYIMEVSHELQKEDLQNIWQNVMPDIATRAKKVNKTIRHQVGMPHEFFPNGLPDEDIRFMIFKIKQRAHNNYQATTPTTTKESMMTTDTTKFDNNLPLNTERHLQYSYNWPYDFCSLVEMGKIEAGVKFQPVNQTTLQAGTNNNLLALEYPISSYKEEQKTSKK